MAQEASALKVPSASAEYDAVVAQLAALREDFTKLANSVSSAAGRRTQTLARDVTDGMTDAAHYVGRKGHDAEARLEHAIAANPFRALGLAIGIGLLLGVLWRR